MDATSLDYRLLTYFVVVAEELHFRRSGERLFIAPSSVSEGIARLERYVGGALFERTSRSVKLTPLGEQLLAGIKEPMGALQAAVEAAQRRAASDRMVIRIGFLGGGLYDLHAPFVELVASDMPWVLLEFVELELGNTHDAVLSRKVDLAIVREDPQHPAFAAGRAFREDQVVAVVAKGHRWARLASIDVEDLASEALVRYSVSELVSPGSLSAGGPDRTPSGRPIRHAPFARTIREAFTRIATGECVGLAPRVLVEYYRDPALDFVGVRGLTSPSRFITRRGDDRPELARLESAIHAVAASRAVKIA